MKMSSLEDLLVSELRDLYSAEKMIVQALPRMAKAASSSELQTAFEEHLEQTKEHVERLETIFDKLGVPARGKKCEAVEGIIHEWKDLISEDAEPSVIDAGLICGAQKVEHYEMAGYGCVRTFARQLGHHDVADLLQQTLDEEGETDHRLTDIAESSINTMAAASTSSGLM